MAFEFKVAEPQKVETPVPATQPTPPPKPATPITSGGKQTSSGQAPKADLSILQNKEGGIGSRLVATIIFGLLAIVCYFGNTYVQLYNSLNGQLPTDSLVASYEGYEQQVNDIVPIYGLGEYTSLPKNGPQVKQTIAQIMDARDITYIHKIKLMTDVFNSIKGDIISKKGEIQTAKGEITNRGFFDQELMDLLSIKDNQISLQRSMLSLEVIKFSTAMKVFGLLNTFLEQFSIYYDTSLKSLADHMDMYSKRAEVDIERYLQACYLNPFEDLKKCSYIGDFDKYYDFFEPAANLDTALFKALMSFIDQKLSETNFPSLSITFDKFNPQAQNLSFKIAVNTLQDDEIQLINKGIISPHIFVVTQIINLLKESKFILGDSIDINDIKIQTQEVDIGGKALTVHSSTRTFAVPLQKEVQREIFDYTPDVTVYDADLLQEKLNMDTYSSENQTSKEANIIGQTTIEVPAYGTGVSNNSDGANEESTITGQVDTAILGTGVSEQAQQENNISPQAQPVHPIESGFISPPTQGGTGTP